MHKQKENLKEKHGRFFNFIENQKFLTLIFILWMVVLGCSNGLSAYEQGFYERAEIITDFTADIYSPPSLSIGDPEKYYWPKVMARFEKYGLKDSVSNHWISELKNRSPFHFTLVGMARLLSLYGDAPALKENKELLLEKVFERTDAHNILTSEGTENHIAMDRTSGYIFAQHALEYPAQFPDAPEKLSQLKDWIALWSRRMYQYGTGEWNSSTYQAYHIIGWLNLYDFAEDEEVKLMARAVLDYYAAEMALHYSWGTYGGSEKRGRGASDQNLSASNYLCWLWFGSHLSGNTFQHQGKEYIQSMHAVTSTYRPPLQIMELARKQNTDSWWFTGSKPSYLYEESSFVKQFFYKGEAFTLGSSVSAYGGWTGATSQLVNWKMAVRRDDSPVPYEVSGSGRFHNSWTGSKVDPFTEWTQHRNVLVQMTLTPENHDSITRVNREITKRWAENWEHDFRRRFPHDKKGNVVNFAGDIAAENRSFITFPMEAHINISESVAWVDLGDVWVAIVPLSETGFDQPDSLIEYQGRKLLIDTAPCGQVCGFALEAFDANNFDTWETWKQEWLTKASLIAEDSVVEYHSLRGDTIITKFNRYGTFIEGLYDWGYGATTPAIMPEAPPLRQPDWPTGNGFGRIPEVLVNGKSLNFDSEWAVYKGPGFTLQNGVMTLTGSRSVYTVDYTGNLPDYSIIPVARPADE